MSDLYRRGDLNAFGMQEVNSPDGSYAYPLAAEYLDHMIEEGALVPVEPDMHEMQRTLEDLLDVYVPLRFVRAALISGGIVEADDA